MRTATAQRAPGDEEPSTWVACMRKVPTPRGRGPRAPCYAASVSSAKRASCPVCRRRLDAQTPESPFCSPRCRLVDLGRWLDGDYRIPDPEPLAPVETDEHDAGGGSPDQNFH